MDITRADDPPAEASAAAPAMLIVRSELESLPSGNGLGLLTTVIDLHPGIDGTGEPRIAALRPMVLHGTTVHPEVQRVQGHQIFRWHHRDSVPVGLETVQIEPPTIMGLSSPPEIELHVGVRLLPEGSIALGPSEDLVLEIDLGGADLGDATNSRAHWGLKIGHLAMHAANMPASRLVVPSGWLEGIDFPATLEFSFATDMEQNPDVSPSYRVHVRTSTMVRRRISRTP